MEPYIVVETAMDGSRQRSVGIVGVDEGMFYDAHARRSGNWLLEAFHRPTDPVDLDRIRASRNHADACQVGREVLASGNFKVAYTLPEFRRDRLAWLADRVADMVEAPYWNADHVVAFSLEILAEPTASVAMREKALDNVVGYGRSGDILRNERPGMFGSILGRVIGSNLSELPPELHAWMDAEPGVGPSP